MKFINIQFFMKKLYFIILIILLVGVASFYGGKKYAESDSKGTTDFSAMRQGVSKGIGRTRMASGSGAFLQGSIINADQESITLKLREGGSKIIFIGESTKITKSIDGTLSDLEAGNQILVAGEENPDGSYTADNIRLEPEKIASQE